jgi:signal transduction histidine kinase
MPAGEPPKKIVLGCMFIAAAAAVAVLLGAASATRDQERPRGSEAVRVVRRDVGSAVTATGVIKPMSGAEVRVGSRISGVVTRLLIRTGDAVQKGQLLAELDERELGARARAQGGAAPRVAAEYRILQSRPRAGRRGCRRPRPCDEARTQPPPVGTIGQGGQWAQGRDFYVLPWPDGGAYLFSWKLRRRVARMSEGQLDVVLPGGTRDEFGVLTDAFNHMVGRIRDMIRARDQLLLDVSHELRSPLTRMKVALELLPEGEKRRSIAADVAEMEAMITELLELERLRDGRGIRTERQDLLPILREVAQGFENKAPGVRVVSAAREIPLDIDGDKIRTVLRNLLENAFKYALSDSGAVQVWAAQDAEAAVVRVTDDGPGIPETELASLFEPFFRVDRSRSKKTGGYGLGLSICKRILEAHGGGIAAENNAGRGATFTLTLPKPA